MCMLRTWLAVALLLLGVFVGIEQSSGPVPVEPVRPQGEAPPGVAPLPTPPTPEVMMDANRSDIQVQSVQVQILESAPARLALQVSGMYPSGCTGPATVAQRRDGNTVVVDLYQLLDPNIMCTMVLRPYGETIPLEGTFEPGTYTIIVNGFQTSVTV